MPTPTLTLSVPSSPLYEGTTQTLTCNATLPSSVDTDVNVVVNWTLAVNGDRVTIVNPSNQKSPFISTLMLSPLTMADAGLYSCEVTAHTLSPYITASSPGHSPNQTLFITGM